MLWSIITVQRWSVLSARKPLSSVVLSSFIYSFFTLLLVNNSLVGAECCLLMASLRRDIRIDRLVVVSLALSCLDAWRLSQ
jgi:hypothetical protein